MSALEKLSIDTPEQIALEYPLAGAGSRFIALAVDSFVQAAVVVVLIVATLVVMAFATPVRERLAPWVLAILLVLAFLLYYGYFMLFEAWWNGQTPGKRVIGIRVITVAGRPLGPIDAILRNLLRIVDQLPGMYAVGLLSIFISARNQRLGDLAAGTVVIHDRPVERPLERTLRHGAARYGAARLSGEEIAVAEAFLARRSELDPVIRLELARRIAGRMAGRLDLSAAIPDEEDFVEEMVSEYRAG